MVGYHFSFWTSKQDAFISSWLPLATEDKQPSDLLTVSWGMPQLSPKII